jgi:lipoprotein-releasing system permease protein
MNLELYIARRIVSSKEGNKNIARSIVSIAVVGIALGMVVMILSVAIVTGFKSEIRNKVIGFGSHITIENYDSNSSFETSPISKNQDFYPHIDTIQGIRHIQVFATKAGIIKTETDFQGILLKGVGSDFDWSFFSKNIVAGNHFAVNDSVKSNKIVISKYIASLLKLSVGDDLIMYFIQNPPRFRKFKIEGLYETELEDFDKMFLICDIAHIQKLSDWSNEQISGFEILIDDYEKLDEMSEIVFKTAGTHFTESSNRLRVQNVKENNPQIFDWLSLSDTNVAVILTLMLIVAGFNMVSGLLILILERTKMIGILKALGTRNWSIRKIFLYNAAFLIGKGLFWGNAIGILLCLIQQNFGIFSLDPASYYVSTVPINLDVLYLIVLNIGTLIITVLMLIIPSYLITRVSPVTAIRFN